MALLAALTALLAALSGLLLLLTRLLLAAALLAASATLTALPAALVLLSTLLATLILLARLLFVGVHICSFNSLLVGDNERVAAKFLQVVAANPSAVSRRCRTARHQPGSQSAANEDATNRSNYTEPEEKREQPRAPNR